MNSPRIGYTPHPNATPRGEIVALAAAYKFVLDRRANQEATRPGSADDAKVRSGDDSRATRQYTG
jgi:hypothetical protein